MLTTTPTETALGGVVLSGVAKSFGPVHAVQGIDIVIAPGETVALLGPNGAGKSTTIDMILGLHPPRRRHGVGLRHGPVRGREGRRRSAAMLQTGSLIRDLVGARAGRR